ncbi:DNA-binding domain-containing protein [Roseateles toxinivorans]|uniref:Putative DNA-binding protein n=1 Tax=Roseateles toxinivorans TaxID=270368 RepID=A0A4R6QTQ8_9BURK|nr:DNA-binding domain-containing protein [Roseateles toxinivorans]TDP74964.1 putative DNA-binding protein [Roseateles toxinivorans]
MSEGRVRELQRQQALVQALQQPGGEPTLIPWLSEQGGRLARGLSAYRANAGASAERALASSFSTVLALMGEEAFAAMARAYWQAYPPSRGDLAWLGEQLPDFMRHSPQLDDEPYLPDSARLDWLLACSEGAADMKAEPASLGLLAEHEPQQLRLRLMPSVRVLRSEHPVFAIWHAHQSSEPDAFAPVRAAMAAGEGSLALVWREGWRAKAMALEPAAWRFTEEVLAGNDLAQALDEAGPDFDFGAWLAQALQLGWLHRAEATPAATPAAGS